MTDDEVTVDREGVRFGPYCWVSHAAITGRQLDDARGCAIATQYLAWVQARLKAQEAGREHG